MNARLVFIFCAGLLLGRIASDRFAPQSLGLVDMAIYVGLAFAVAWAWRSWARRAFEQRRRDALARQHRNRARAGRRTRDAAEPPSDARREGDA